MRWPYCPATEWFINRISGLVCSGISGGELIDVLAWTSLVVAIITALWLPGRERRHCNNQIAFSAALLAVASTLFILAYPNNRRVVAMFMVLGAVILELIKLFIAPRRATVTVLLLKVVAALIGTLLGAILVLAVQ